MVPAPYHGPLRAARTFAAWHTNVHQTCPLAWHAPRWAPHLRASMNPCRSSPLRGSLLHLGLTNRGFGANSTANAPADNSEGHGATASSNKPARVSQQRQRDGKEVVLLLRSPGKRGPQPLSPLEQNEFRYLRERAPLEHPARTRLTRFIRHVFLPTDYPASVTGHYIEYATAAALTMLFSTISKVLATQAMLLAVGLGMKKALPLAAMTSWVLKDGLGHLGAIAFGTLINTRFDSDPKRYRFQAVALGKVADLLSILTLSRPEYFLLLSSLGGTCGRIATGAAASSRARIYETFCRYHNLGDLMRCSQSQTTAAILLGTAIGAALGPFLAVELKRLIFTNLVLAIVTLSCAYRCSSVVQLRTLNWQRAELIFLQAISCIRSHEGGTLIGDSTRSGSRPSLESLSLLSVEKVQKEEIFVRPYRSVFEGIGKKVNPPIDSGHFFLIPKAGLHAVPYTLAVMRNAAKQPSDVAIWFHACATSPDTIQGFFHSCLLRALLAEKGAEGLKTAEFQERCENLMEVWWPLISESLTEHGWRNDVAFLDAREDRIVIE